MSPHDRSSNEVRATDVRAGQGEESDVRGSTVDADARVALYGGYVSNFKRALHQSAAPSFEWWDHKYLPLLKQAGVDRAAVILDLGCGDGSLLAYLGRRGFSHARGIDISAEQIEVAQARGVQAERADALEFLAAHVGEFAVIIAADVFEHFTRDELMRLGDQIANSLEPGGHLLVQTANGAGLFPGQVIYGDLTHQTILTPESLQQLLRSVGFSEFRIYETGPVPLRLRGKLNVALWTLLKAGANAARQIETGKRQAVWTENFICLARKP